MVNQGNSMVPPIMTEAMVQEQIYNVDTVSCVYYGGEHLFENCSVNPASVNYVGNNNRGNNLYGNTYHY